MLWYWLTEGKLLRPQMKVDRENIFWWWITSAMPACHIPAIFIGDEADRYFNGIDENFRESLIPLTRFFSRAYRESDAHQKRYNLSTEAGLVAYSFDSLLHNLHQVLNSSFLGSATLDFWTQTVGNDKRDPSVFELALALNLGLPASQAETLAAADLRKVVRHTILERAFRAPVSWRRLFSSETIEAIDKKSPRRQYSADHPFETVSIIGMPASTTGLGVNSRMSRATFEHIGLKVNMLDARSGKALREESCTHLALFHLNADAVPMAILEGTAKYLRAKARVGFYLWELNFLPENQRLGLQLVDEIWVPSEFLRGVYAKDAKVPVRNAGKYLIAPDLTVIPSRRPSPFTFLVSFDFHSGIERKNPLAAVRAFAAAFKSSNRDVALVIKTTEYVPNHWGDPYEQWLSILEIAKRDNRIRVIADIMSESSFFRLISDCDCVISPHRAEGFGYLPAYAMLLRKAVIATDYSGTADFCTPQTSWLLKYKMKPLRRGDFIVDVPGAIWADVELDHLAATMVEVVQDEARRTAKCAAGHALVQQKYSLEAHSRRYLDLLHGFGYSA
jgi:glycosyltransferase involved in cell wall biosynthesis